MKFRTATAGAALVIGAMTATLGTAYAAPAPAPKPAGDVIDYSVKLVDKAVVATLQGGTFQVVQKPGATPQATPQQIIDVKDKAGTIAMEMPVDYRISGKQIPVAPVVKDNGRVLQLTPQKPTGVEISKQTVVATPIASPEEDNAAMTDFATKFGLATGIGSFVGLAIGAVVGCIFGLPLFGVGCIAGIPIGATLGGIIGTVAAGGPTLVAAGMDLISTLQAKPYTTKWKQAVSHH